MVKGICEKAVDSGLTNTKFGDCQQCGCSASGHAYSVLSQTGAVAKETVVKTSDAANKVFGDAEALQQVAKLAMFSMLAATLTGSRLNTKAMDSLESFDNFVDATGVFRGAAYFINGEHREDLKGGRHYNVLGKIGLFMADTAGGVLWLGQMGVLSLAKMANTIGSISIFGIVKSMSLLAFTRTAAVFGFSFYGVAAFYNLLKGEDFTRNMLMLTNAVSEVALKLLALGGITHPVGIVVLGLTAAATSVLGFLYRSYNKGTAAQAPAKKEEATPPVELTLPVEAATVAA